MVGLPLFTPFQCKIGGNYPYEIDMLSDLQFSHFIISWSSYFQSLLTPYSLSFQAGSAEGSGELELLRIGTSRLASAGASAGPSPPPPPPAQGGDVSATLRALASNQLLGWAVTSMKELHSLVWQMVNPGCTS